MGQQVAHIVYSPNGQLLGANGKTAAVWNVATGNKVCEPPQSDSTKENAIRLNSFYKIDDEGQMWGLGHNHVTRRSCLAKFPADGGPGESLMDFQGRFGAISPDGKLLALEFTSPFELKSGKLPRRKSG